MASLKLELFKSKKYIDGRHPIMLRITHNRANKYVGLKINAFPDEWDDEKKQLNNKYRTNYKLNDVKFKLINSRISEKYNKAIKIINDFEDSESYYTVDDIVDKLKTNKSHVMFYEYTNKLIENYDKSKRLGNADVYKNTLNKVKNFTNKKDFPICAINYNWLSKFEVNYLGEKSKRIKKNPINGLNVYMRTIRSIINKAIREKLIPENSNPFKSNGYTISSAPVKKASINFQQVKLIKELELPPNTPIWHTKNYFLFSFYAIGMSWVDLAYLKISNISDGRIEYVRYKNKRKNARLTSVKIIPQIQEILDFYTKNKEPDDYVFPIITRSGEKNERKDYRNGSKNYNKYLKKIAEMCGIEKNLTSIISRHSWSVIAKNEKKITVEIISESLTHKNKTTTDNYLEPFDKEEIDAANDLMTSEL